MKYRGIDTDSTAFTSDRALPLPVTHMADKNLEFVKSQRAVSTRSWYPGDFQSSDISDLYVGADKTKFANMKSGFYSYLPTIQGFGYDTATSGYQFSTSPWEPGIILYPYHPYGPCKLKIILCLQVKNYNDKSGTSLPLYIWPDMTWREGQEASWAYQPALPTVLNTTTRNVAPGDDPDADSLIWNNNPPPNLQKVIPNTDDTFQFVELELELPSFPSIPKYNSLYANFNPRIALNFLSTRSTNSFYNGSLQAVYYNSIVDARERWTSNWDGANFTVGKNPGAFHFCMNYERKVTPDSTVRNDWYYIEQIRSRGMTNDIGNTGSGPFSNSQDGDVLFNIQPSMSYISDPSNEASRMQNVNNNDNYSLHALSYCILHSISVIEEAL